MALRGDIQGGQTPGLMSGNPALQGIQDNKWKWGFFAGAICTTTAGVVAVIGLLAQGFTFAPGAFVSNLYLLGFGLVMLVLDTPFKNNAMSKTGCVGSVKDHTYKFMLFLTRFTGRGIWYLFLSTIIFVALYDDNTCPFLGYVLCLIVFILGVASLVQGLMLSNKLKMVQAAAVKLPFQNIMSDSQSDLTKEQFAEAVKLATHTETFKGEELDYIVNALSFTANNDGRVSRDELMYWLHPVGGGWLMV